MPPHRKFYPQAEPPDPVTWIVLLLIFGFILGTIMLILIKASQEVIR